MELLPEFMFTVVFSLLVAFLFSFVLPMVSSLRLSRDVNGKKSVLYECESRVEPEIHGGVSELRGGFVEEAGKVEEFMGEEAKEETLLRSFVVDESCGLTKGHEVSEIDEYGVFKDVEVVYLKEKSVEEEIFDVDAGLCGCVDNMLDESSERAEFGEIEVNLAKSLVGISESEEIMKVSDREGNDHENDGSKESAENGVKEEGLFGGEDDWEGIERTELERLFGAAVAFVGSKNTSDRVSSLGSDVKMRLDGLHKIAIRGPCFEPQPMAFKISARAKWNAWQQLGNMSAELAMEQYIVLVSESVPGWIQHVHGDFGNAQMFEKVAFGLKTLVQNHKEAVGERKVEELKAGVQGLDETGVGG